MRLTIRSRFQSWLTIFWGLWLSVSAHAELTPNDQLLSTKTATGDEVAYILTQVDLKTPRYALIIQPGGSGSMNLFGNFLVRSRSLMADEETLVIDTDTTTSPERIKAIMNDVRAKYPAIEFYVIGTSRGTFGSMGLGEKMDGEVSGFIHTSSMSQISAYDTRYFKSRHLIVHHESDGCRVTPYSSAKYNNEKFGTPLMSITGGQSVGDPCQAFAYHGYKGIESEVIGKIKTWMKQPGMGDGASALPKDYASWPKFLSAVQRPDNGQVREIYMSPLAKDGLKRDRGFPQGSVLVMENYAALKGADGVLQKDANGQLIKGPLLSIFVMAKGAGWPDHVAPELKTGNWVYTALTPSGDKGTQDLNTCRQCHLPLTDKDYIHRFDQYWK